MASKLLLAIVGLPLAGLLYFLIRLYQVRSWFRRQYQRGRSPPHSWIWGNLKIMAEAQEGIPKDCHPMIYLSRIGRKYDMPDAFYMDLWPFSASIVSVSSLDAHTAVTITQPTQKHASEDHHMALFCGNGNMIGANGALWKTLHGMIGPIFAPRRVKAKVGSSLAAEARLFRASLRRLSDDNTEFLFEDRVKRLVYDIGAGFIFGRSRHAQLGEDDVYGLMTGLIDGLERWLDFRIMMQAGPITGLLGYLRWRQHQRVLNKKLCAEVQERWATETYPAYRAGTLDKTDTASNVLDNMLREYVNGRSMPRGLATAPQIEEQELTLIVHNLRLLMLAGLSTVADTTCQMFMLLEKHPEAIRKMQEEHERVFGGDSDHALDMLSESPDSAYKLNELPYTDGVIRESLRLFPIGFTARYCHQGYFTVRDQVFETDHHLVAPVQQLLHYDPNYYPEPTKFRPERWLDQQHESDGSANGNENGTSHHENHAGSAQKAPRTSWKPFERGSRACPGQDLAMDELRMILISTIRDFTITYTRVKPNPEPRAPEYTNLDTIYGTKVFTKLSLAGGQRDGSWIRVSRVEKQ